MQQTISFVTLGVRDLARSRAFYGALGWKESSGSEAAVAFYQMGCVALALFGREDLAADAGVPADGTGFSGITLAHNVDSESKVNSALAEAVAAGGTLVLPGQKAPWGGYRGYFSDPDGYLWEICFNPYFSLDEQGFVRLPE